MRIPHFPSLVLLAALPFAATAANHEVLLGQGGNTFQPNFLEVQAGDTVTFRQVNGFHNVSTLSLIHI